jgi:hypothetical protein
MEFYCLMRLLALGILSVMLSSMLKPTGEMVNNIATLRSNPDGNNWNFSQILKKARLTQH